jgi:hypothetical protein
VSGFDIDGISSSLAEHVAGYLTNLLGILTNPSRTIHGFLLVEAPDGIRRTLSGVILYAIVSIAIGLSLATFIQLPGEPPAVTTGNVISILFIWVLYALILHLLLKLFGGKGPIVSTVAVFLLVVSTLQLFFIPVAKTMSLFVAKTQVILTYDYAVYMGRSEADFSISNVEVFLKENEPDKVGTVLVPLDKRNEYALARIPVNESPYPLPTREEERIIDWDFALWIVLFSLAYYLVHSWYLAQGLSIAHSMRVTRLLVLGVLGAILAAAAVPALALLILILT